MRVEVNNQIKQVDDFVISHKGMDFHTRFGNVSMWKDTPIDMPNICRIEIADTNELVWFLRSISKAIKMCDYKLAERLHYELRE